MGKIGEMSDKKKEKKAGKEAEKSHKEFEESEKHLHEAETEKAKAEAEEKEAVKKAEVFHKAAAEATAEFEKMRSGCEDEIARQKKKR